MDRGQILAVLNGYFGDEILKEIVQQSGGDSIVLYHDAVIPTVDQPTDVQTVYISPGGYTTMNDPHYTYDPDRQGTHIPQVTRFMEAKFTVVFKQRRDIYEGIENSTALIAKLQRFYPYALTKGIALQKKSAADKLRIDRGRRDEINRKKNQTQKNISVGANVFITLINDVIVRTNSKPSSDIGLFERKEFLNVLMETLKGVDIMNNPAIHYPNAR
jgi:hypothetical protein